MSHYGLKNEDKNISVLQIKQMTYMIRLYIVYGFIQYNY